MTDCLHPTPPNEAPFWQCGARRIDLSRVALMAILNVTPDSFSDGGRHNLPDAAAEHGLRLLKQGADIIDIGGESTRPGCAPVPLEEELRRVLPAVTGLLARAPQAIISVDTMKAEVARQAIAAGALIINDISAGEADPAMLAVAAESGAGLVLMHMQGAPQTMQQAPRYDDVTREVYDYLERRLNAALAAGVRPEAVTLDPGLGFGKTFEHNVTLCRRMAELARLPRPLLIGPSRKSFLRTITGATAADCDAETFAAATLAVAAGARVIRVHAVAGLKKGLAAAQVLAPCGNGAA